MRSASHQPSPDRRFDKLGGRAIALIVVLVVHVLLLIMLLTLAPPQSLKREAAKVFELLPSSPSVKPTPAKRQRRIAGAAPRHPQPPQPAQPVEPPKPLLFGIQLDQPLDIAALPNHRAERAAAGTGAVGAGTDSVSVDGVGEGPGGATLYNAEWYREPTHAELAPYLTGGAPLGSWGMIACRTIEQYHVEDCQEIGESPPGSGLARALRQAAWQFRVRPPRTDGKPMVGAWVRIRFDFTERGEK